VVLNHSPGFWRRTVDLFRAVAVFESFVVGKTEKDAALEVILLLAPYAPPPPGFLVARVGLEKAIAIGERETAEQLHDRDAV
jgi:hypothetical protein